MSWYPRPSDLVFYRIKRAMFIFGFEVGAIAGVLITCIVMAVVL